MLSSYSDNAASGFFRAPLKPLCLTCVLICPSQVGFFTYAAWFGAHFWLLDKSGDGDGFMTARFQVSIAFYYFPCCRCSLATTASYCMNGKLVAHSLAASITYTCNTALTFF